MPVKQRIKNIVRLSAPLFIAKSSTTEDTAVSILHSYSPDPSTTCVANNTMNPQYDLQIIVPAYNVDKYVAECLESAVRQK